jgi:hypothetical protein
MSLSSFVRLPDVAEKLKPFRPPVRRIDARPKVPRVSDNPQLVGTAFDYLLRFELQRQAPHAAEHEWVAELVPQMICGPGSKPGSWVEIDLLHGKGPDEYLPPSEVSERIAAVCRAARRALAEYLQESMPSEATRRSLACWATRLAKIDGIYRGNSFDPTYQEAPGEVVNELVALLACVPFELLTHPEVMMLNPVFGEASGLVGGADADLITGDMLVDVKTTNSAEVRGEALDQLFGYFLLARRAGMPPLERVGLYFSRYSQLRTGNTAFWTERTDFAETEKWFFERAKKEFPPVVALPASALPKPRRTEKRTRKS